MRTLQSDEVNFMIWRYLQESGYRHSTFTFGHESQITKSKIKGMEIPPGSLIRFLQKGIQYLEVEQKIADPQAKVQYSSPFELLHPGMGKDHFERESKAPRKNRMLRRSRGRLDDRVPSRPSLRHMHPTMVPATRRRDIALIDPQVYSYQMENVSTLKGHDHEVFICAWNPKNPSILASGSGDSTARIWTIPNEPCSPAAGGKASRSPMVLLHQDSGAPVASSAPPAPNSKDVTTLDWHHTGDYLATGSYDGKARIWTNKGSLVSTLTCHKGPIFSLRWNRTGNLILSGSVDNTAIVWEALTGHVRQQFQNHQAPTLDVDWKDDLIFATCSTDKTIAVCEVGKTGVLRLFNGHTDEVNAIKWSPDGSLLASCSDDYSAKIWGLHSQHYLKDLKEHEKEIYTIKWSPTGRGTAYPNAPLLLASASFDSTIKLWDVERGVCKHTLTEHTDPVYSVAFAPDGRHLASGSFDSSLHIWDVAQGKLVRTFRGTGSIFEVCWNCAGDKVSACFSNSITEDFIIHVMDFKM